ncbi:tryptophan--tRNA ligase [Endomicrobium proavitum]|uniref:Tryptophan--tRNA ligase n=1 Tax=Endomicrobium proavitum TaxID=1408281 RepID=A0A0G3WI18_9BACT|nr:tryptophan--tRNA ligase [Endomicrobium proavitum]AKL97507.1 Tryptophan--tRNA ligase [Endomicrobium proavitum]
MRKTVLSGMRPTGRLHLGHYFGALNNWVQMQNEYNCYYMSADWHALTTDYADTSNVAGNILEMVADWLTAGVDPQKAVLFKQSAVSAHSELFLILSMITPLGWLERCPTYKEQKNEIKNKDLNNFGFLGYPVLMASDILIYKADYVPVGEDQLAHLEFSREITRRFNNFYGNVLVEPQAKLTKSARVPGLDGRKMSKSYGNSIFLGEDDDSIKKKVQTMFTDPLKIKKDDPGHPEGCVVFAFHKIFNKDFKVRQEECKAGAVGCVACKKQIMEMLSEFMKPLAQKRKDLISDKSYLQKIIDEGSSKANETAQKTLAQIRKALKF